MKRIIQTITQATGCCAARHILKQWVWSPLIGTARLYIGAQHGIVPALHGYAGMATTGVAFFIHAVMIGCTHASWIGLLRNLPLPTAVASLFITCMARGTQA